MNRSRVLIIKHGFSETCDHSISPVVSLGDVFRCTCLLEDFKGCEVTWITARDARDLLEGNHLIDHLLLADSPGELPADAIHGHYDKVINLEKQMDWCEFAAALPAVEKFGFKDWASSGNDCFYPASARALSAALERGDYRPTQETLFATVGHEWRGQRYSLGYQPRIIPMYDIGLNHHVGSKWPTKAWPRDYWHALHHELAKQYSVSWQQSLNSVKHYIDWIASNRILITCDSLGLHLVLSMRRKAVALFGPTAAEQVYMYGKGIKLTPPSARACIPCYQSRCEYTPACMELITVEMVVDAVKELLKPHPQRQWKEIRQAMAVSV